MDFITGFRMTMRQHDSIMVVVDKLTKATHFISVKSTHKIGDIAKIFMKGIFKLHGSPKEIVFDRDFKFTPNFLKGLFLDLGTKLNFSTAYHPHTDGKIERVNKVFEDMLRMYVMDKPTKWEYYLHLVEFAYNNGQQASLEMSPYEALYGRSCRTPMTWDNPVNNIVLGPYLLKEMEQEVAKIRKNLKAAQDRQKRYADKHREEKSLVLGIMFTLE